ncbi:Na+/H+ antiporter NhaA [Patulibacter americanus]|uniref:Na+/H+ antiporter NhaA n=1 Tax=Patulibacter americanus TaxID=588672 RepID=UPI0003B70313|nr:Na+/H+ antiporter NhaA [Patulibacter americanus]
MLSSPITGGALLLVAVIAAVVWVNAFSSSGYADVWGRELTIGVGDLSLREDLRHWINDGLMAIFFLVLGLEVKHEFVAGSLRNPRAAAVPIAAALGGAVVPALVYVAFTWGGDGGAGWGIPMATDVAFAIGVLALLGSRIVPAIKTFLLTLAVVDDILAVLVIAVFYTDAIAFGWLAAAVVGLLLIVGLQRARVGAIPVYVVVGLLVWLCMHESGVHATIAGVALGLLTPARAFNGRDVLHALKDRIEPVTALVIVPLFALANAGVVLTGGVIGDAASSGVALGVLVGLLVGKPVGIAGVALLVDRLGIGHLDPAVRPVHVIGIGALAGIGFTVSLFISDLAFDTPELAQLAKIGVFAGSLASGIIGAALLLRGTRPRA